MLASRSDAARQVVAGLDAALCALGRKVGETGEFGARSLLTRAAFPEQDLLT